MHFAESGSESMHFAESRYKFIFYMNPNPCTLLNLDPDPRILLNLDLDPFILLNPHPAQVYYDRETQNRIKEIGIHIRYQIEYEPLFLADTRQETLLGHCRSTHKYKYLSVVVRGRGPSLPTPTRRSEVRPARWATSSR